MSLDTCVLQGNFVSTGASMSIPLRCGVDWMYVYNYTQAATQQADGVGVQFYWQNGMAADTGIEYQKTDSTDALNMLTLSSGGFTYYDSSINTPGGLVSVSAVSDATPPLVTAAASVPTGTIVRMLNITGAQQLGGYDFTATYESGITFELTYMVPIVAGTTGNYRVIPYDPYFYPRNRYITDIESSGVNTVVTLSVTHGYTIGQAVRLIVPAAFGMVQANGLLGNVIGVDLATNSITLDINSAGFTAFAFPLTDATPFTKAQVVPVGETANADIVNPNLLDDATRNEASFGMTLSGGADSPAGSESDLIYWQAGKAFSNQGMSSY